MGVQAVRRPSKMVEEKKSPRGMSTENEKPADFETAIRATGFGKFNLLLMFCVFPASCAQIFEQTGISYVMPIAQCDLGLTLESKGIVASIGYAGMISSGFLFGYICDAFGRRNLISYGYLMMACCTLMAALSPNLTMLLIARFFSGFMFTGAFSATASYITECHSSAYRSRVQLVRGVSGAIATLSLPLIAWGILSKSITVSLFGFYDLHAWNLFLTICFLAPVVTGILFSFMPESPKFLMSKGKNEEALEIFRRIYSRNTGNPPSSYPIKQLVDELEEPQYDQNGRRKSIKITLRYMLHNIKPLFRLPYALNLVHVCCNAFLLLIGTFSIKLWYPQLLQAVNDYVQSHNGTSSTMCDMMEDMRNDSVISSGKCEVNLDNSSVYKNSIILGIVQLTAFSAAGTVVNLLGKKKLVLFLTTIAGSSAISVYFATNAQMLMVLFPLVLAFGELSGNLLVTTTLEIFPTNFRTISLAIYLISARIGIMTGNIIFPYLLRAGCVPPFIFAGVSILSCTLLTYLLPDTENKALK